MLETISFKCNLCGDSLGVTAETAEWDEWFTKRPLIQNCFPNMSASDRELILSGTCNDCWNWLFGEE